MKTQDQWGKETSPFHEGEQAIQQRLGVSGRMESFGRRVIRPYLPGEHREFYSQLPYLVVGSVDAEGWPWASLVAGQPGFVWSPDELSLHLGASPFQGDPLADALVDGAPLGLLGIDLATRRRNRVSVRISSFGPEGIALAVDQAFGNCPQYIQTREPEFVREPGTPADGAVERPLSLDETAVGMIQAADTFFVSSYVPVGDQADVQGVDVSHRGGKPGFVKVEGDTLTVPDFAGNKHFNTLGNFAVNPKAGLVFVNFETGDLLQLTGNVELLWEDDPVVRAFQGAERAWRFTLDHGVRLAKALPIRWRYGEASPRNERTGTWAEASGVTD